MNFPRTQLKETATRILAALHGLCERMEPTGALRRGDPTGSGIEFICQTKNRDAVIERCRRHTYLIESCMERLSVSLQNGLEVRLWFARFQEGDLFERPFDNFGVLQVIHTPTRGYLRAFVQHVTEAGFFLSRYDGLMTLDHRRVSSTEEGIYSALNLKLPSPACRLEFRPQMSDAGQEQGVVPASWGEMARHATRARGPSEAPAIS